MTEPVEQRALLAGFRRRLAAIRRGEEGGLASDAFYAAVWQGAGSIADLVQIALIANALGVEQYGRFAIAASFVMLVAQFFDVRIGVAATTFGARELTGRDNDRAAGLFQLTYLIDGLTGVLGFVVVVGLGAIFGPKLVGTDGFVLVAAYALIILASTVDDSSLAVMRLLDRYRLVAIYSVALESLRIAFVAFVVLSGGGLIAVALALAAHRFVAAIVQVTLTNLVFRRDTGRHLFRGRSFDRVRDIHREMVSTIFHTNVVSYARLTQTQLPTVLLGALGTPYDAGLYKLGMAGAAGLGRLADPAQIAFLPRLSRLLTAGRAAAARRLVRRATVVSATVMAVGLAALIVFRGPILDLLGGGGSRDASSVLIIGGFAFAINGALFWNTGVLFAAGRASLVAKVAVAGAVLQVIVLIPGVLRLEALGAAIALLISFGLTNAALTMLASRELSRRADPT